MAVKIISDIHGDYDTLARQLDPEDTAVLLGDYLNLIDFRTLDGILAEVFTREQVIEALTMLASGEKETAKKKIRDTVTASEYNLKKIHELSSDSYRRFFQSIPCESYMIYGNTDNPALMREYAGDNVTLVEAGVVDIQGETYGLVSGTPHGPWTIGLPGEVEESEYDRRIGLIGDVDILCTHYPPAIPELTWDMIAGRDEVGSENLLRYIDEHRPSFHYFGHVHNPKVSMVKRGSTRIINAGFFKAHGTAFVHRP